MTSLVTRAGLPLAVLACAAILAGCNSSSKSTAASDTSSKPTAASDSSDGANTHSAIYQKECQAMVKIFTDKNMPAAARDPETIISNFKNGPAWKTLTTQQQNDAVAGIRKAGTGSCD